MKVRFRIGFDRPNQMLAPHAGVFVVYVAEAHADIVQFAGKVLESVLEQFVDLNGAEWVCESDETLSHAEVEQAKSELDSIVSPA